MGILTICALGWCGVSCHPSEKVVQALEASPQMRGAGGWAGAPLAAVSTYLPASTFLYLASGTACGGRLSPAALLPGAWTAPLTKHLGRNRARTMSVKHLETPGEGHNLD